jgi:hypothetical protein
MFLYSTPPKSVLPLRSKFFDTSDNWTSSSTIIKNIDTPWERGNKKFAKVIENILTHDECILLTSEAEDQGFEDALVNIGNDEQLLIKDIRKWLSV